MVATAHIISVFMPAATPLKLLHEQFRHLAIFFATKAKT